MKLIYNIFMSDLLSGQKRNIEYYHADGKQLTECLKTQPLALAEEYLKKVQITLHFGLISANK